VDEPHDAAKRTAALNRLTNSHNIWHPHCLAAFILNGPSIDIEENWADFNSKVARGDFNHLPPNAEKNGKKKMSVCWFFKFVEKITFIYYSSTIDL